MDRKKALVICGPTASGKSAFADDIADVLTGQFGASVPTIGVDSMQVYREIPVITNQARRRPAELVGITSVSEDWTVALHQAGAETVIDAASTPFILDAGTGMYLNAIILDVPLAPKVDAGMRRLSEDLTADAQNPRRAARAKELEIAGVPERGSIWEGEPRFETVLIYLRPESHALDDAIALRSERIATHGLEEARRLAAMRQVGAPISASVLDAIGVRELVLHVSGHLSLDEAISRISTRTRQLARRQRRWFDKLVRSLEGRINATVVTKRWDVNTMHNMVMRGRIGS